MNSSCKVIFFNDSNVKYLEKYFHNILILLANRPKIKALNDFNRYMTLTRFGGRVIQGAGYGAIVGGAVGSTVGRFKNQGGE